MAAKKTKSGKTRKQRRNRDLRNGLIMEIVIMVGVIAFFQPQWLKAFQTNSAQTNSVDVASEPVIERTASTDYPNLGDSVLPYENSMASFTGHNRY